MYASVNRVQGHHDRPRTPSFVAIESIFPTLETSTRSHEGIVAELFLPAFPVHKPGFQHCPGRRLWLQLKQVDALPRTQAQ